MSQIETEGWHGGLGHALVQRNACCVPVTRVPSLVLVAHRPERPTTLSRELVQSEGIKCSSDMRISDVHTTCHISTTAPTQNATAENFSSHILLLWPDNSADRTPSPDPCCQPQHRAICYSQPAIRERRPSSNAKRTPPPRPKPR